MSLDIDAHVVQATQKALGKYIKKPPLTEKLLRKPPFRFLHDIVTSVIRDTGFLKGLYSERELVSDYVKEKEDKMAFLNKLIDAVKAITGMKLSVRAAKVIAGLEPEETNLLLQAIGKALDRKLDSSAYVADLKQPKKVLNDTKTKQNDKNLKQDKGKIKTIDKIETDKVKKSPNTKNEQNKKTVPSKPKVKEPGSSSRGSKDIIKNEMLKTKGKVKKIEKIVTPQKIIQDKVSEVQENLVPEVNVPDQILITEKNSEQEQIGNLEPNNEGEVLNNTTNDVEVVQTTHEPEMPITNSPNNDANNITNNDNFNNLDIIRSARPRTATLKKKKDSSRLIAPQEENIEKPFDRPRSSLRPPSVRPSSARPGAPRLRSDSTLPEGELVQLGKVNVIVENYDSKNVEDEETVTIETAPEIEYQQPPMELPTDKGHLVDQILKQLNKDELTDHLKPVVNIEWEQDGLRSRNAASKEIEQLRSAIQTLTRTANPLGKLVNYLHEDIEAMHTELEMWINSKRQIMSEIAAHKRFSIESNKPLLKQLEEIENTIVKHRQQIVVTSGSVIRNEHRIRDLLSSKI